MHSRLRGPNNLLILHQIIIEPDFSCTADEIVEPRPDMNIKVAAFTVSEKSLVSSPLDMTAWPILFWSFSMRRLNLQEQRS